MAAYRYFNAWLLFRLFWLRFVFSSEYCEAIEFISIRWDIYDRISSFDICNVRYIYIYISICEDRNRRLIVVWRRTGGGKWSNGNEKRAMRFDEDFARRSRRVGNEMAIVRRGVMKRTRSRRMRSAMRIGWFCTFRNRIENDSELKLDSRSTRTNGTCIRREAWALLVCWWRKSRYERPRAIGIFNFRCKSYGWR